jgi:hypothetical protein
MLLSSEQYLVPGMSLTVISALAKCGARRIASKKMSCFITITPLFYSQRPVGKNKNRRSAQADNSGQYFLALACNPVDHFHPPWNASG